MLLVLLLLEQCGYEAVWLLWLALDPLEQLLLLLVSLTRKILLQLLVSEGAVVVLPWVHVDLGCAAHF